MAWRKPPRIAPKGLKRNACPDSGADSSATAAAASAEAAAASASAAASIADRLSKPKHTVEVKARRNPKEVREAALAKAKELKMAKAKAKDALAAGADTPKSRVRTTVTKTTSTADGASETTTVEKVAEGAAAPDARYNKKKTMHPEDARKLACRPIPKKPSRPRPRIKAKTVYPKDVHLLWDEWQRYDEFQEEVKCWKQGLPYLTKREKEDRRFQKFMKKEEEMHEAAWMSGQSNIKPFHLRGPKETPAAIARKERAMKKPKASSTNVKDLPRTPGGKRRYTKKDWAGNMIRYNSVDDPHPEDIALQGGCIPPYVAPPLTKDGMFKKPKQMTPAEREALCKYRKWEEFYFKVQSWENDKKWVGDPQMAELWKIDRIDYTDKGPVSSTSEGRAEARAAEQSRRKLIISGKKPTKAQLELQAALKKRGGQRLTGAARVALESLAKKEAEQAAAEEARAAKVAERQKKFLRRGTRAGPVLGRGKVDVSKARSKIAGLVKAAKAREAAWSPDGNVICPPPAVPCPPQMVQPPVEMSRSPGFIPPECPLPYCLYERYEEKLRNRGLNRRKYRELQKQRDMITKHMVNTGNRGDLTSNQIFRDSTWDAGAPCVPVQVADMGIRPHAPVIAGDSTIFPYRQHDSVCQNYGLPTDYDDEDEELGCEPMPEDWEAEDAPVTPLGARVLRCRGFGPSPPQSRIRPRPLNPAQLAREQFKATGAFADFELEDPEERAFADRCAEFQINKPLVKRRLELEAQVDENLLHPAVYRSNLMGRMRDTMAAHRRTARLGARTRDLDVELPDVERIPVARMENIPSPRQWSPQIPCADFLGFDEPNWMPQPAPPTPPLPPPAYTPPPRSPPCVPPASPFQMPARFNPAVGNPYLQVAQRSIASRARDVPCRAQEIADTFARVQAAARGPRPRDFMSGMELEDMQRELAECPMIDEEEEGGGGAGMPMASRFVDYHQCEGPFAGALYHEHSRQPQLGPWHYSPPGGRDCPGGLGYADPLVDVD